MSNQNNSSFRFDCCVACICCATDNKYPLHGQSVIKRTKKAHWAVYQVNESCMAKSRLGTQMQKVISRVKKSVSIRVSVKDTFCNYWNNTVRLFILLNSNNCRGQFGGAIHNCNVSSVVRMMGRTHLPVHPSLSDWASIRTFTRKISNSQLESGGRDLTSC